MERSRPCTQAGSRAPVSHRFRTGILGVVQLDTKSLQNAANALEAPTGCGVLRDAVLIVKWGLWPVLDQTLRIVLDPPPAVVRDERDTSSVAASPELEQRHDISFNMVAVRCDVEGLVATRHRGSTEVRDQRFLKFILELGVAVVGVGVAKVGVSLAVGVLREEVLVEHHADIDVAVLADVHAIPIGNSA